MIPGQVFVAGAANSELASELLVDLLVELLDDGAGEEDSGVLALVCGEAGGAGTSAELEELVGAGCGGGDEAGGVGAGGMLIDLLVELEVLDVVVLLVVLLVSEVDVLVALQDLNQYYFLQAALKNILRRNCI